MEARPGKKRNIRKLDILLVFLRSFFLQSVWNYRSLISVGFGICLFPIMQRLYQDVSSRKAFLQRHLKFFNAHPYMASYALGVSIRLEEAFARGDDEACNKLERVKELLASVLGAVGDRLFWFTIKPFSLIIGICGLFLSKTALQVTISLIITFLVYNVPHIYLRLKGILEGYEYGMEIYRRFNKQRFRRISNMYIYFGIFAFLLFLSILIVKMGQESLISVVILIASSLSAAVSYRYTKNLYFTVFLAFVISIAIGIIYFL